MTLLSWIFLGVAVLIVGLLVYIFSRKGFKVPTFGTWTDCDKECARMGSNMVWAGEKDANGNCICRELPEPQE